MTRLDSQLEHLLAPGYLDGLEHKTLAEVREMRAECQTAETAVSFLRRLAQGRLDIIHAFLDRRDDDPDEANLKDLVDELPQIISAGPPRSTSPGRFSTQMLPDIDHEDLTAEVDEVLDARRIGELPTMSPDELAKVGETLSALEARISNQRRSLHERIDRLQAEIVSRYKTGEASVDGLLA